jgi:RNA polymerase sigma-70 factor (ECF subfamily)
VDLSTDHQLMLAVRDGNVSHLGVLFQRYHLLLFNFFMKQTGNRQTSEDLVQEVFLRMLKYRQTYQNDGNFKVWMFQIAHHAHIDSYRKQRQKLEPIEENQSFPGSDLNPEQLLEQSDNMDVLRSALNQLSPDKKELIILGRFQNLPYKEISQILNCSEGTVKVRMFRVLKELTQVYFKLTGEKSHGM